MNATQKSNLIKYLNSNEQTIINIYLIYVNDFISVERFAEYYSLSVDGANLLINQGRNLNNNLEKVK